MFAFASSALESADAMYSETILSVDAILDRIPFPRPTWTALHGNGKILAEYLIS